MTWLPWRGTGKPKDPDRLVTVKLRCGMVGKRPQPARNYRWTHEASPGDIVEVRI